MTSLFVVLSEVDWGCYPYIEAIKSFLPVVDEIVIGINVYGKDDGSREKIEELKESKIRIVSTIFDLEKYGWISHGISRTLCYQACKGDVVVMIDADDIFHEKDIEKFTRELRAFRQDNKVLGYFVREQVYSGLLCREEFKHSGIYNKRMLEDKLDFLRLDGKGAPNIERANVHRDQSRQFLTTLFAYEHFWDTWEVLKTKVIRQGKMIDKVCDKVFKSNNEYYNSYLTVLLKILRRNGIQIPIDKHPLIIREKITGLNATHFGYNFFDRKLL